MHYSITFTSSQFRALRNHLFPGDNKEAVAIALCGKNVGLSRHRLLVKEIILIPYHLCSRTSLKVKWSTSLFPELLKTAVKQNLSIIKIHSHPNEVNTFSTTDDSSDLDLFASVYGWTGDECRHASAILFQDDNLIGRVIHPNGNFQAINVFNIVGDDITIQNNEHYLTSVKPFGKRVAQTFGEGTYNKLQKMKVAVIGCSGTGSIVVEILARNGVGELVLIDPDIIEEKNLNRIPNSFMADAKNKKFKVDVLQNAISKMGLGTNVVAINNTIFDPQAISAVAECDFIFGCMDGIEGRHVLNRIATFYLIPYSDLGVKLIADGKGGIEDICGTVHYLQPGGSSLLSRKLYTLEQLRAESLKRTDRAYYNQLKQEKYIVGANEENPAVISVNMFVAALAANDFLSRIHPFRNDLNSQFAIQRFSLVNAFHFNEEDGVPCSMLKKYVGRGDMIPLLDMPHLSEKEIAA